MSLYNLVHGMNPLAHVLLAALGLDVSRVPRFRDCWWDGKHIAVHTRTGGGNREDYQAENDSLCAVDGYSHDADDDFDCTYATFYYTPSATLLEALNATTAQDATPAQRWESFLGRLEAGVSDPQVDRVKAALAPVISAINETLEKAQSVPAVESTVGVTTG